MATQLLLVIDNAGFHACQNINIPENIKLIRIPLYAAKLNPAEKVWQWMEDKVSMKFFEFQWKARQALLKAKMEL